MAAVTRIWNGAEWVEIQGVVGPEGPTGADGADGAQGADGVQGPPGPTAVSSDAGNEAILGSDSLIYVSEAGRSATDFQAVSGERPLREFDLGAGWLQISSWLGIANPGEGAWELNLVLNSSFIVLTVSTSTRVDLSWRLRCLETGETSPTMFEIIEPSGLSIFSVAHVLPFYKFSFADNEADIVTIVLEYEMTNAAGGTVDLSLRVIMWSSTSISV